MSRRKKDPLREFTDAKARELSQISQAHSAPVVEVIRAKILLAVASGLDYQSVACSVGRCSGDAVSHLVARFNLEGLAALKPRHGGGRQPTYGPEAPSRIVAEATRMPTPENDGTASWSISTLQKTFRKAVNGLPGVSTYTIRLVLRDAGIRYQRTRSWCPTGSAVRRRKIGPVLVTDPDAESKNI